MSNSIFETYFKKMLVRRVRIEREHLHARALLSELPIANLFGIVGQNPFAFL